MTKPCCCPHHPTPVLVCMMENCKHKRVRLGFCERHAKVYESWFKNRKWEAILA